MLRALKNTQNLLTSSYGRFFRRFSTASVAKRGENRQIYPHKVGAVIENFTLEEIKEFPDFGIKSYSLTHNPTGARFMHLDTPDQNNCFAIIFKTLPANDKGTPHILEHLMTCGSKKYPVRDPFMQMIKRSLNTYMNAWTGPDFTAYPFSSQNEKDFRNLMDLYTSLCFEPMLNYYDFLQEGWRYEIVQNNEKKEELIYKGVVFNEMKGNYQSSQGLFLRNVYKNLFPESKYSFDSGGIPENIPELSHEELKEFFNTYCHPSNMKFFSYGDLDFTEHLKYLQKNYLYKYQKNPKTIELKNAKKLAAPKTLTLTGPKDPFSLEPGKDGKFGVAYLCNDIVRDSFTSFSLNILSYMLLDTPNSPLYKALIESGLATNYCPGHGYEPSFKESSFVIGVQDISLDPKEIEKIEGVIEKTLKDICEKGFDKNLVEGTIHQIEVNSKIANSNFGISLLQKMLTVYNLGGDCGQSLEINKSIQRLREEIGKGKYFEGLIEKFLLKNTHKLRLIMSADENYTKKEVEDEKKRLADIFMKLSEEQKKKIKQESKILEENQEKTPDITVLPCLEIEDISKNVIKTNYQTEVLDGINVRLYEQPTNGLTFLRMKVDLTDMTAFFRQYLDMFNSILPRLGTNTLTHNQMSDLLSLYTTNLGLSYNSFSNYDDFLKNEQNLVFNVACLDKNIEKMFEILEELITNAKFNDSTHLQNLLKNFSSDRASSLMDNSLRYALSHSASQLRESQKHTDLLSTTRFLCNFTSHLVKSPFVKEYIEDLNFHFNEIVTFLLNKNRISFSLHSSKEKFNDATKELNSFISKLKSRNESLFTKSLTPLPKNDASQPDENFHEIFTPNYKKKFFSLSGQVNYVVETVETTNFSHQDTPKFHVLSHLMTNTILHKEIREKGGAYGSGCKFNNNGLLSFFSFRDPRSIETYEAFKKAVEWVQSSKFTDQDIKEAKLNLFSSFDRVEPPQERGLNDFIYGFSDEQRQKYRENLLKIDRKDLVYASDFVNAKLKKEETSKVIFGSEDLESNENMKKNNWSFEKPLEGRVENAGEGEQK